MNCFEEWLETPLGQYLLEREYDFYDRSVGDIFGFHAIQLGLPCHDFLRTSRIPLRLKAASCSSEIAVDYFNLPFASDSIDLVLLPHLLEFSCNPHQILREVERVMRPEGKVVLSGFNPFSLWGMRRLFPESAMEPPWNGNFISLPRLKDWYALLGLEVSSGKLGCYRPPFDQEKWLSRFDFMEKAGDRWWPVSGGVYFLVAIKRVKCMTLLRPSWKDAVAQKQLAPAVKKFNKPPCRKSK